MNLSDPTTPIQQQAFEICEPGVNFDPNVVPQNGDEFLTRMIFERNQCPAIVCKPRVSIKSDSDNQQRKYDEPISIVYETKFMTTDEWKAVQVADFKHARSKIWKLRESLHEFNYDNELEPPLTTNTEDWERFCRENAPLLSIILRLKQRTLEWLLEQISEWLCSKRKDFNQLELNKPLITLNSNELETINLLNRDHWLGMWLYATLTCLHLPLEPSVYGTLREIARICLELRNQLSPIDSKMAMPYNLFLAVIVQVFRQWDLAEFI